MTRQLLRGCQRARALRSPKAHTRPDDLPSQAIKVARQRSLDTLIGKRCRFLGRVDSLNPQLVEIGDFSVIGGESMLLAHGLGFDEKSVTSVGDYVYIGYRATVLPGVKIGDGCIIGTGAIVTRDIPPGKVVVGNPGRILRDVRPDERADIQHRMDHDLFFGRDGTVT
jgi:acetyltransferase-like isoleucine patch superfamily enzyme